MHTNFFTKFSSPDKKDLNSSKASAECIKHLTMTIQVLETEKKKLKEEILLYQNEISCLKAEKIKNSLNESKNPESFGQCDAKELLVKIESLQKDFSKEKKKNQDLVRTISEFSDDSFKINLKKIKSKLD